MSKTKQSFRINPPLQTSPNTVHPNFPEKIQRTPHAEGQY